MIKQIDNFNFVVFRKTGIFLSPGEDFFILNVDIKIDHGNI
jgi:hypothetical protein